MTTVADRMTQALNVANAEIDDLEREVDELRGMLHSSETQRKLALELFTKEQQVDFEKRLKALRFEEKAKK